MERALRPPYFLVPAAIAFVLIGAFVLGAIGGVSYRESLRSLMFYTGLGLIFLGGAVGGSGRIVHDWRTHYISSRGARALAEHNVKRLDTHGVFLTITIVAGLALLLVSFVLPV